MKPIDYSGADYVRYICGRCQDFRRVSAPGGLNDANGEPIRSIPCPVCGTDEQRREQFTRNKLMPEIRFSDLTEEEREVFQMWRHAGHHELDCLRWVEGRRYDHTKDKEFLKDCFFRLAEWREARDKRHEEFMGRNR